MDLKNLIILGKTGMLGHMIFNHFRKQEKYSVVGTTRKIINPELMSNEQLENKLIKLKPNVVINCIGIINKYSEQNEDLTIKLNGFFPHFLQYLSLKHNFKLIHISSDCVVDNDIYGRSKFIGEINDNHNLTIRTSIIGPELKNFNGLFEWFMKQENTVKGFSNALWDGVTTLQLARFIDFCIQKNICGLINYRTRISLSKYELLKLISETFNKKIEIIEDSRDIKDKRNLNSEYWCEKTYKEQLFELKEFMEKNEMYNL